MASRAMHQPQSEAEYLIPGLSKLGRLRCSRLSCQPSGAHHSQSSTPPGNEQGEAYMRLAGLCIVGTDQRTFPGCVTTGPREIEGLNWRGRNQGSKMVPTVHQPVTKLAIRSQGESLQNTASKKRQSRADSEIHRPRSGSPDSPTRCLSLYMLSRKGPRPTQFHCSMIALSLAV